MPNEELALTPIFELRTGWPVIDGIPTQPQPEPVPVVVDPRLTDLRPGDRLPDDVPLEAGPIISPAPITP